MPRWFLIVNGMAMVVMGATMLMQRVRQEGRLLSYRKFFGVTWALLCCTVGAALLMMATGRLSQPGAPPPPVKKTSPVFPTDR